MQLSDKTNRGKRHKTNKTKIKDRNPPLKKRKKKSVLRKLAECQHHTIGTKRERRTNTNKHTHTHT